MLSLADWLLIVGNVASLVAGAWYLRGQLEEKLRDFRKDMREETSQLYAKQVDLRVLETRLEAIQAVLSRIDEKMQAYLERPHQ